MHPTSALRMLFSAALLSACCSGPPRSSAPTCKEREADARAAISVALNAHVKCDQDSDCRSISFSSSCFDSCSRAVNADGVSAVNEAQSKVNAGECATFRQDGCPLVIPPCPPPATPRCIERSCQ